MHQQSYKEVQDILMKEHQEKYDAFTKFMLGLSVGFITFTVGLNSGNSDFSSLNKSAILLHSISILSGIWLQYLLLVKPIVDLKTIYSIFNESERIKNGKGEWFSRNPTKLQSVCFVGQIVTFLGAFSLVVIGVLT